MRLFENNIFIYNSAVKIYMLFKSLNKGLKHKNYTFDLLGKLRRPTCIIQMCTLLIEIFTHIR